MRGSNMKIRSDGLLLYTHTIIYILLESEVKERKNIKYTYVRDILQKT